MCMTGLSICRMEICLREQYTHESILWMVVIVGQSCHVVDSKLSVLQQPHIVKRNMETTLEAQQLLYYKSETST